MGRASLEAHAELWRQRGRLLGELDKMARKPADGPTAPDLHDLYRVKDALLACPFAFDAFAEELAHFLALAGITPEWFAELVESTS